MALHCGLPFAPHSRPQHLYHRAGGAGRTGTCMDMPRKWCWQQLLQQGLRFLMAKFELAEAQRAHSDVSVKIIAAAHTHPAASSASCYAS